MILTAFIHFKGLYVHETNWSKQSSKNPNDSASNENSSNNFTTMLNCFVDLYGVSVTFAPKSLLSHCVRVCGWTLATHTLGLVHIDSVFKRFLAVFRCLHCLDWYRCHLMFNSLIYNYCFFWNSIELKNLNFDKFQYFFREMFFQNFTISPYLNKNTISNFM